MELWHESSGEGDPVLLVHSGICDSGMWDPQWESFPQRHLTARCDLRGYGRTPLPPEPFSHGADLVELMERLDLGPMALVGASFGGLVCLDVAVARTDLVSRLVLVAAPVSGHDWSPEMEAAYAAEEDALGSDEIDLAVELNLRTWVDGPHRGPDEVPAGMRRRVGEMQRRAFEHQLPVWEHAEDELLNADLDERLGDVAAPTLVVDGELDVPDFGEIAARLAAGIPGSRHATIAAAAHLPSLERPGEFDSLVLAFLAGEEVGAEA